MKRIRAVHEVKRTEPPHCVHVIICRCAVAAIPTLAVPHPSTTLYPSPGPARYQYGSGCFNTVHSEAIENVWDCSCTVDSVKTERRC